MAAKSKKKQYNKRKKASTRAKRSRAAEQETEGVQNALAEFIHRREFKASVVFIVGLFLLIVTLFAGQDGSVWNAIHSFYVTIFGMAGYYLPPAILFLGVVNVLNRHKPVYLEKVLEIFLLFVGICGILHINTFAVYHSDVGYFDNVGTVFVENMSYSGNALTNGGVLGALFGGALFQLGKSQALANIFCAIYLLAVVMFLFGITLFKLFVNIEKPVKKAGELTGQAIDTVRTDMETKKKEREENGGRKAEAAKKGRAVQGKPKTAAQQVTQIVEDFYAESDETAQNKRSVNGQPENPFAEAAKNTGAQDPDDFDFDSIFDRVEKRRRAQETAVPPADGTPAQPANGEGAPADKEKAKPLSEEEQAKMQEELDEALEKPVYVYVHPPLDCLKKPVVSDKNYDVDELRANGEKLIAALNSFNVSASISDVIPGPTVTRYELLPAPGVKISKFTGLADDLALHMAAPAGLRIEAPIPNKAAIGIEIPNRNKTTVSFREIIDNDDFRNAKSKLNAALGKNIAGDVVYSDIAKMPHLLVAGTTGSGKSVCMNTMIVSLLYNAGPDEVRMILIDPKQVEFGKYNGIPHLLVPVVSDPRKASGALGWAVTEMLSRYKTLNANGVRDIKSYNSLCEGNEDLVKMPQIVIFIDELADLMTVAPAEVEDSIQRIAQMGRAAGMHLVIATQRPSVDVITGVIKANIPSRIALTVKSQIDSRTMIDQAGAEKLMGYGDMLYYPVGVPKPIRVQGAFITDAEIDNVVAFLKDNGEAMYDDGVQQEIERQAAQDKKKGGAEDKGSSELDKGDDLLMRAIELFVNTPEKASISALQRHLGLGFAKAGRLMDTLEEKGIVGPTEGSKPRKVLITKAQWYEMSAMSSDVAGGLNDDSADGGFDE